MKTVDVTIVGGGFAGLAAAEALREAGWTVCLLEGQDRVGGRAETIRRPDGSIFEGGAQGLNADMALVQAQVKRFGLHLVPFAARGRVTYDGLMTCVGNLALMRLEKLFDRALDEEPGLVALAHDPAASVDDALRYGGFKGRQATFLASHFAELWGLSPANLQFAHALEVYDRYASDRDDWELQIAEGFGAIAQGMQAALGDVVQLGQAVTQIARQPPGFVVTKTQETVTSRALLIAVPPSVAHTFLPPMPKVTPALAAYRSGDLIKWRLQYSRPFWRKWGFSGDSVSIRLSGFASTDTTVADSGEPTLTVFLGGLEAERLHPLPEEAQRQAILEPLVRLFGSEAADPVAVDVRSWVGDRWSGGAYNAHVTPGRILQPEKVLRQVQDGMTFASAELAEVFPGYVEGALHAGQAAAQRLAAWLEAETRARKP